MFDTIHHFCAAEIGESVSSTKWKLDYAHLATLVFKSEVGYWNEKAKSPG